VELELPISLQAASYSAFGLSNTVYAAERSNKETQVQDQRNSKPINNLVFIQSKIAMSHRDTFHLPLSNYHFICHNWIKFAKFTNLLFTFVLCTNSLEYKIVKILTYVHLIGQILMTQNMK